MSDDKGIDVLDFIPNEFLTEVKGDQPVSSSMFDAIFIAHNRVPKELVDRIASNPELIEQLLLSEVPIFATELSKPYWKEGSRGFDSLDVEIYGTICLADDRHMLDVIVAHGNLITNADKYTLREVCESLDLRNVAWERLPADAIDAPMLNKGVYFHIEFNEILKAMGLSSQKKNKEKLLERLRRLSIMHLSVTPKLKGKRQDERTRAFSIIDKDFFVVLDKAKIANGIFTDDTVTDLIVNVHSYYWQTLERDGSISRKRLKTHYKYLVGKNAIEDCYKWLDTNKRSHIHGKRLDDIVDRYLQNKISLFGINYSKKRSSLISQLIEERSKLLDHFNLILKQNSDGHWIFLHVEILKNNE